MSNSEPVLRSRYFPGPRERNIVYGLCLWNAICGGTLYMFPGMETKLMSYCDWGAREVDLLYSAGQLGVGMGFLPGFLFQTYSVKVSSLYSALLLTVGSISFVLFLRWTSPSATSQGAQNYDNDDEQQIKQSYVDISGFNISMTTDGIGSFSSNGGNSGAASSTAPHSRCAPASVMAVSYWSIQHGSSALYQNGLFTALSLVRKERIGVTSGVVSAGYGLSAAIWNIFYAGILLHAVDTFVKITGVIWTLTAICGIWVLQVSDNKASGAPEGGTCSQVGLHPQHDIKAIPQSAVNIPACDHGVVPGEPIGAVTWDADEVYPDHDEHVGTPTPGSAVGIPGKNRARREKQNYSKVVKEPPSEQVSPEHAARLNDELLEVQQRRGAGGLSSVGQDRGRQEAYRELADDLEGSSSQRERLNTATGSGENNVREFDGGWRDVIRTKNYWAVFWQFAITQCVGSGLFIANLKLITGSFGFSQQQRDSIVTFVSLANCGGRLTLGFVMDMLPMVNKARYMLLTTFGILCGCLALIYEVKTRALQWLIFLVVGISYGGNWAIMPAYMTDTFGKRNIAFGFVTPVLIMAVLVKLMSQLAGEEYDHQHNRDDNASHREFCEPVHECFDTAASVGALACSASMCIGAGLFALEVWCPSSSRNLFDGSQRKPDTGLLDARADIDVSVAVAQRRDSPLHEGASASRN